MDAADRAQQLIDDTNAANIARALSHANTQGRRDCADCGEEIPTARRAANPAAIRCIDCQQYYERRDRRG